MSIRRITLAMTALLTGCLVLAGASGASAQEEFCYPPPCTSSISDSTVQPGESITATSGEGSFTPGETIEYGVQSTYQRLGEVKADASGAAVVTFAMPTNLELGRHHVVFTSLLTGKQVRVAFTLFGAPATAQSGLGTWLLVAVAVGAALIGALLTGLALVRRHARRVAALTGQVRHASLHDPLTGLPTRALLHDRIEQALQQRIVSADSGVAVLRLDLGGFKALNEALGHDMGDRVLIATSRRLESLVRPGDTIAHLGGDQFALVLPAVDVTHAVDVAHRVAGALAQDVDLTTVQVVTAGSIGIALSDGSQDAITLLEQADTSLLAAKARTPGGHQVFSSAQPGAATRQALLPAPGAATRGTCAWTATAT